MNHQGVKIASLIKCKFTRNTKGVVSLFDRANKKVNIFAEALHNACKKVDIYALSARKVRGGGS